MHDMHDKKMTAKRRADSAASSFSIMCIMLILPIMFLALCNKLEIASKPYGQVCPRLGVDLIYCTRAVSKHLSYPELLMPYILDRPEKLMLRQHAYSGLLTFFKEDSNELRKYRFSEDHRHIRHSSLSTSRSTLPRPSRAGPFAKERTSCPSLFCRRCIHCYLSLCRRHRRSSGQL